MNKRVNPQETGRGESSFVATQSGETEEATAPRRPAAVDAATTTVEGETGVRIFDALRGESVAEVAGESS